MFPINAALLPTLQTRQALLVVDLQNDFVSSDGALPVPDPEGYVSRITGLANAFRASGKGDVIWVRTEFEAHRPLTSDGDQIITIDAGPSRTRHHQSSASTSSSSRGRRPTSGPHDAAAKEADPEAYLCAPGSRSDKPECVRPGTDGSLLAPQVDAAKDDRDFTLTKTHYSAFASGPQLLQLLRGRFVTELYVCGALTNISIYATALDAGRHGYEMTILEDCCGYRTSARHTAALSRLMDLTGCEVVSSEDVIEKLQPTKKTGSSEDSEEGGEGAQKEDEEEETTDSGRGGAGAKDQGRGVGDDDAGGEERDRRRSQKHHRRESRHGREKMDKISSHGTSSGGGSIGHQKKRSSVRSPAVAADDEGPSSSSGLHLSLRNLSLSGAYSPAPTASPPAGRRLKSPATTGPPPPPPPHEADAPAESLQPMVAKTSSSVRARSTPSPSGRQQQPKPKTSLGSIGSSSRRDDKPAPSDSRKQLESNRTPSKGAKLAAAAASKSSSSSPQQRPPPPPPRNPSSQDLVGAPPKTTSSIDAAQKNLPSPGRAKPSSSPPPPPPATMSQHPESNSAPVVSEPLCEGDTAVISDVLPPELASTAFERLKHEVEWQRMSQHGGEVPRLVAVQGAVDDQGDMPVYRHPSDESPPLLPFSPTVLEIKAEVEKHLCHPLNHVLIQLYRDGTDYISEHSDKTLDIVRGSFIANVSLGAERTMVFRTKRPDKDPSKKNTTSTNPASGATPVNENPTQPSSPAAPGLDSNSHLPSSSSSSSKRQVQRAPLPHNSLCRMGLQTNMRWLHSIRQDKRADRDKNAAETAFAGQRVSLTFRRIGTFLDASQSLIWGQGATAKTRAAARPVSNGQSPEAVRMLQAFGTENHSSAFDWACHYGPGFDVLHMTASPRWFAGPDPVVNVRVALMLAYLGVSYAKGNTGGGGMVARFADVDAARSVVEGQVAVMLYLDAIYGRANRGEEEEGGGGRDAPPSELARRLTRFEQAVGLLDRWRALQQSIDGEDDKSGGGGGSDRTLLKPLRRELAVWEGYAKETREGQQTLAEGSAAYIAGGARASIADFALWPVLHDMERVCGGGFLSGLGNLAGYYRQMRESKAVISVLEGAAWAASPAATSATAEK